MTWDGSTWPATLIRRHPSGSYDVRFDVSSVQSPPLLSPHSPHMVAREALPLCASLRNKVWSIPVQNCPTWMEADAFRRKSGGGMEEVQCYKRYRRAQSRVALSHPNILQCVPCCVNGTASFLIWKDAYRKVPLPHFQHNQHMPPRRHARQRARNGHCCWTSVLTALQC